MGIFYTKKEVLNEVYFGETPDMVKLQSMLSEIRADLTTVKVIGYNSSSKMSDLNRHVEKMFGFNCFALHILPDRSTQAYTFPVANKLDTLNSADKLSQGKDGFKFSSNIYSTVVNISSGILLDKNYSDREVMAIILHEIGHSFATSYDGSTIFGAVRSFAMLGAIIESAVINVVLANPIGALQSLQHAVHLFNFFTLIDTKIEKILYKIPGYSHITSAGSGAARWVMNAFSEIGSLIMAISLFHPGVVLAQLTSWISRLLPFTFLMSITTFPQEQLSDNFATAYGYGADLSTALEKLHTTGSHGGMHVNKLVRSVPEWRQLQQIIPGLVEMLAHPLSTHPTYISRIKSQLDMLEAEIAKSDTDAKMKKEISLQINDIKGILARYDMNAEDLKNSSDPDLIEKGYQAYLLYNCDADVRRAWFKDSYKMMDKVPFRK